jgi:hypothetical protein
MKDILIVILLFISLFLVGISISSFILTLNMNISSCIVNIYFLNVLFIISSVIAFGAIFYILKKIK